MQLVLLGDFGCGGEDAWIVAEGGCRVEEYCRLPPARDKYRVSSRCAFLNTGPDNLIACTFGIIYG